MSAGLPWRAIAGGVELSVRLTPRAGAERIEGVTLRDGRAWLAVRVAAPPVDGAANAALTALIARALDLPRSAVTLAAGGRGREKRLHVRGVEPARLASLVASSD